MLQPLNLGALDVGGWCLAVVAVDAAFPGSVAGPVGLDVTDGQPQQFDHGLIIGEARPSMGKYVTDTPGVPLYLSSRTCGSLSRGRCDVFRLRALVRQT